MTNPDAYDAEELRSVAAFLAGLDDLTASTGVSLATSGATYVDMDGKRDYLLKLTTRRDVDGSVTYHAEVDRT